MVGFDLVQLQGSEVEIAGESSKLENMCHLLTSKKEYLGTRSLDMSYMWLKV